MHGILDAVQAEGVDVRTVPDCLGKLGGKDSVSGEAVRKDCERYSYEGVLVLALDVLCSFQKACKVGVGLEDEVGGTEVEKSLCSIEIFLLGEVFFIGELRDGNIHGSYVCKDEGSEALCGI